MYQDSHISNETFSNNYEVNYQNIPFWLTDSVLANMKCISGVNMTSEFYSTVKFIGVSAKTGVIKIGIRAFSGLNKTQSRGGDMFLLWAEQADGDGRVAGHVTDNMDGSYTGLLKLYWTGKTIIKAKLGNTLENYCIRKKAVTKYGNAVFSMKHPFGIKGMFVKLNASENTLCGTEPVIYGYKHLCNFTKLNDGQSWFCGKPRSKTIACADIRYFGQFKQWANEDQVIHTDPKDFVNISGHGTVREYVTFLSKKPAMINPRLPCHTAPKARSWSKSFPRGFYQNNVWQMLNCRHTISFNVNQYRTCLYNKTVALFGDSTIRQIMDVLLSDILLNKNIDLKNFNGTKKTFAPPIQFKNFGISVSYKKHEMPIHGSRFYANGIHSVATEIGKLVHSPVPGKDLVVVITYGSHMLASPLGRYRERWKSVASAVEMLLKFKPEANVFIKGPHVYYHDERGFDLRVSEIQKDIIFEEFKTLKNKVVYLDLWSLSVALNSEELHVKENILSLLFQQLMSYICSV